MFLYIGSSQWTQWVYGLELWRTCWKGTSQSSETIRNGFQNDWSLKVFALLVRNLTANSQQMMKLKTKWAAVICVFISWRWLYNCCVLGTGAEEKKIQHQYDISRTSPKHTPRHVLFNIVYIRQHACHG